MTRAAFFLYSLLPGGCERRTVRYLLACDRTQIDPCVIIMTDEAPLERGSLRWLLDEARIPVLHLGAVRADEARAYSARYSWWRVRVKLYAGLLRTCWRLRTRLRALKPDVLLCAIPVCNVLGAVVGRWAGVPRIIVSQITAQDYGSSTVGGWIERLAWRWADAGLATSGEAHLAAGRRFGRPGEAKTRTVRTAVPIQNGPWTSPAAAKQRLGLDPGRPAVGMLANLYPYKEQEIAIHALALLPRRDVQLVLCGHDAGAGARLRELAALADVSLVLPGYVEGGLALAALDVVVHTCPIEGLSNALVEAMAAGKPIVAVRGGGNREALNGTGALVHDAREMAGAIECYLLDPAEALRAGMAARARAAKEFGLGRFVAEMTALLEDS